MATGTIAMVASIISAVSAVVSLAITLSMDKPEEGGDIGSSINRKGQDNPNVVPFGNCLVPSVKVWSNVSNTNTKYLLQTHSIGVGKIKNINQIFIDGVPYGSIVPNKWQGLKHSSEFPNLMMGVRLGEEHETAYSELFPHADGEWNDECRGDRTATISMMVERWINKESDNDIRIVSDRFKVEALVDGVGVIDPRYDVGLEGAKDWNKRSWNTNKHHAYRNPANVMLTYLLDDYYGMGLPVGSIDIKSFIDLANHCDSMGYYFDGYVDQNQTFGKVLIDMCTAFDGIVYVEDGLIKVKSDRLSLPVTDIDESDCVGSFRLSNANDGNYFNTVNVEFTNIDTEYASDKYVLPKSIKDNPTIIADGFQKTKDIKLPYTTDGNQFEFVKRIANKNLKKVKFQKIISFDLDNTKKNLGIYDVFTITNHAYKLNKKSFRVDKIITTLDDQTMVSKITASEYDPSVYDDTGYEDGNTSTPTKPPSLQILAPVSLAFKQTGYTTTGSGRLTWVSRYQKEHRTVIEYKLSSANDWFRVSEVKGDTYDISNLAPDNYDFRVMTQSFMGSTSPWNTLDRVVIKGGVTLPTVTSVVTSFTGRDCILSWDDMKSAKLHVVEGNPYSDGITTVGDIFSHYEIQVFKGSNNAYAETLSSTVNGFTYSYDLNNQSITNRDLQFKLFIVARDGSTSLVAATADAFNNQMPQPTSVEVDGVLVNLNVKWEHPSEVDYSATEVHISNVANFVPSVNTLVATPTAPYVSLSKVYDGVHYCRVGHYDVFGKDGIAYSAPITFTMKDIDDVLEDSPLFDTTIGDLNNNINAAVDELTNDINTSIAGVNAVIDSEVGKLNANVAGVAADVVANAKTIAINKTAIGSNAAKITENKTAITGVAGNLASFETEVAADFNGVNAGINTNKTAIATQSQALTTYKTEVTAKFKTTDAAISKNATAVADANKAIVNQNNSLTAKINSNTSAINTNKTAISTANSTIAALDTKLTAAVGKNTSGINTNAVAVANTNKTVASLSSTVTSNYNGLNAKITSNTTAISDANKTIANVNSSLSASINGNKAGITNNATSIANTNKTVSSLSTTVTSNFNNLNGKITTNSNSISSANQSISSLTSTVSANYGSLNGKITNLNTVVADNTGKITATTNIAQTVNGKTSGLIMVNDGNVSKTAVIADKFMVCSDANGTNKSTAFQVVGGVVSMRNALIKDLTATNIKAGSITGNNIASNTKIVAGSGNHSASMDGTGEWRFYSGNTNGAAAPFRVDKAGKLYSTNADVKGIIRADQLILGSTVTGIKNSELTPSISNAQNTANTANTNAGNAQIAANNAGSVAGKIDSMIYPNQSKIHISSSNYVSGKSGWAIDQNGSAEFSDVTVRGRVHGSVITGSAIQASYIASNVRMLTLSWYNQERYGSMDVGHIEGSGNKPYMGYNVGVTGSQSIRGSNAIAYVDIKSYDYGNTSEHIRYTRKQVTPSFSGSGQIEVHSGQVGGNQQLPSHDCKSTVNAKIELFHDGSHVRTFETGGMSNGQTVNHADFTANANISVSTTQTGSGGGNNGSWVSYTTTCTGSFNLTMKHHTYNGNRSRLGARVYIYNHSNRRWEIAAGYSISDTALNDYAPSDGGAN